MPGGSCPIMPGCKRRGQCSSRFICWPQRKALLCILWQHSTCASASKALFLAATVGSVEAE